MAANSKKTPKYEYSKTDVTVILKFADGSELPLEDRWETATLSPNADTGTLAGSGQFPRAHRAKRYAPEFSITVDVDLAEHIVKRAGARAIAQVKLIRQRPGGVPITNLINDWDPPLGDEEFGDDATTVELTGLCLSFELDKTQKIPTPGT